MKKFNDITSLRRYVNEQLNEIGQVSVSGKISELRHWTNGYTEMRYITIVDDKERLNCSIHGSYYKQKLDKEYIIEIEGNITTSNRGDISIRVVNYRVKKADIDKTEYDKLVDKVIELGYTKDKKPVKDHYQKIGILSQKSAQGFMDIVSSLNDRLAGAELILYECRVQGKDAPNDIIKAIEKANQHNYVDILILARGGGSREDLNCFDDIKLAKIIYTSNIPIVTGLGHQQDKTIADEVSARSFITPTAIAGGITKSKNDIIEQLLKIKHDIVQKIHHKVEKELIYVDKYNTHINKFFSLYYEKQLSEAKRLKYEYVFKIRNITKNTIINLTNTENAINSSMLRMIDIEHTEVKHLKNNIKHVIDIHIMQDKNKCSNTLDILETYNTMLTDGKCQIVHNGNIIRTLKDFNKVDTYEILFMDGTTGKLKRIY